ncbi:MAG: hypothetical protein ACRD1Z_16270, partial [Vicinamibacteria bacterium]
MKGWNKSGLRTSLTRGRKLPVTEPSSESVFRLGGIPIVDRWLANQRIRGRQQSIKKIGDKVEKMVSKERQKIESVIDFARRTDIRTVHDSAIALRDKLEKAACVKLKFKEVEEDEEAEVKIPGLTKDQKKA